MDDGATYRGGAGDAPTEVRRAVAGDTAAVEAIVAAAYQPYVALIGRPPGPMLDDYAALIDAGRVHVLVEGVVRGVLVLIPEAGIMLLDNVAIAPDAHGRGFGRTLLAFAEMHARTAGYGAIRLYTNVLMARNIELYARHGYIETHRGEYRGIQRVYMRKVLA